MAWSRFAIDTQTLQLIEKIKEFLKSFIGAFDFVPLYSPSRPSKKSRRYFYEFLRGIPRGVPIATIRCRGDFFFQEFNLEKGFILIPTATRLLVEISVPLRQKASSL